MIEKYIIYFYYRLFLYKNIIFEGRHTFRKKNLTLRSADIVRSWCKNLDEQEQWEVFVFFMLFVLARLEQGEQSTRTKRECSFLPRRWHSS